MLPEGESIDIVKNVNVVSMSDKATTQASEPVAGPTFRIAHERMFLGALVGLLSTWFILFGSYGWTTVSRYCAEHYDFGIYVQHSPAGKPGSARKFL